MIVLRTPKGWTGPREVDGEPVENTWRSHQIPLKQVREDPGHLRALERWLRSYRPEELFDDSGRPRPEVLACVPRGERRLGAGRHARWLQSARQVPWRAPVPRLNYLLTSHIWRQDHNGFSHQDPGFVDHVLNKSPEVVRGYRESGATTTPFDTVVRNDLGRYRLVMDVVDRVPGPAVRAAGLRQEMRDVRERHHEWVREHGTDLPEVTEWSWPG